MKTKRTPKFMKKLQRKNQFEYPKADYPREKEFLETFAVVMAAKPARKAQTTADAEVPTDHLKALVSIANNFWRARKRMLDAVSGEVREDTKRIHRDVEAIRRSLAEVGIVICYHGDNDAEKTQAKNVITIRDHTGNAYDEGEPMEVIASKPTPGLDKKRVSETLLPSISWNNQRVQNGQIEIATPASPNTASESQPHQP